MMAFGTLIVAGLTWFVTSDVESLQARAMNPVIGFSASTYQVDFLGDATRDPAVLKGVPEDQNDASRIAQEIKEFREDLTRSKGERALELHEQLYLNYAALAYYFENITSGQSRENYDIAKAQTSLDSVRSLLIKHATVFQKTTKQTSARMRALFHVNATMYLSGQNRKQSVANLKEISGKLGSVLKERAEFIVAMDVLSRGNRKDKLSAARTFSRIAGSMGPESKAAANIIAARSLAGLSATGSRVHAASVEYRGFLGSAASAARNMSGTQQDQIIVSIVSIWRKAEGNNIDWSKPPFGLNQFSGSTEIRAIIERMAITDYAHGKKAAAIKKYYSLATSFEGFAVRGDIDLRIVDLYLSDYNTSKSPVAYERNLIAMSRVYLDTGILGQGNETKAKAVAAELSHRYKALAYQVIAKAGSQSINRAGRLQAIAMADRYLATISDNKEIENIKSSVANLYVLNKQHSDAVAIYKELAETSTTGQNRKYFALAIRSQSIVAQWPENAPWNGIKAGYTAEREELLVLFKKLAESDKTKLQWFITAHAGLLEINLNRVEQAFASWQAALAKDATGVHAANAAGFMLVAYQKAGDWNNLEALTRVCLSNKLAAIYMNKRVDIVELLALALLEGGKDAMEQSHFDVAVVKLKEFVAQHQKNKRHDEGYFILASAYRGAGQHEASIKTLQGFVERYPLSKYYRQALLNGGEWSSMMAYEENVIFFFNKFEMKFSQDTEAPRVRRDLVAIYLGRALYADAIGTMNAMLGAANQPVEDKIWSVATLMNTEDKHGSSVRAEKAADLIIRASNVPDDIKAEAYVLKARISAKKQQVSTIVAIEAKLQTLNGGQPVADALGEVRYMLAFASAGIVAKEFYNQEIRDPAKLLNKRFNDYKVARAAFLKVCSVDNAYCAPAMYKLARSSDDFAKSLESIEIQDTLAKEVVQSFVNQKQTIMNYISSTIQKADSKAVNIVGQGQTDPDWAQAVLWQNSSDWNFDRVSGETGNGYVQWSTSSEAHAE